VHALVYQLLLIYPAFFIHHPERVAANYERYKTMTDIWASSSGCVVVWLQPCSCMHACSKQLGQQQRVWRAG
jgi:hypothetical protein